jgi:hypothetical protein
MLKISKLYSIIFFLLHTSLKFHSYLILNQIILSIIIIKNILLNNCIFILMILYPYYSLCILKEFLLFYKKLSIIIIN